MRLEAGAHLTVHGSYTQQSPGMLNLSIGGSGPGEYASLDLADGTGTLGGRLNVLLSGGYTPARGQRFTVLRWGARTGAFSTVWQNTDGTKYFTPDYQADGLVLTTHYAVPGDINLDAVVNLSDFALFKNFFGGIRIPEAQPPDLNGDGVWNLSDFAILKRNFGQTEDSYYGPLPPAGMTAVPEPATLSLLGVAALLLRRLGQRRRG